MSKQKRRFVHAVVAFLLVFGAVVPSRAQAPAGTIVIQCATGSALIFVDHIMLGKPPLTVTAAPGAHEVRVSAGEDYVPYVQDVNVGPAQKVVVTAVLKRTSPALYRDAITALRANNFDRAARLFDRAAYAPGKHAADIPFYQGLLAERRGDLAAAQRDFVAWVNIDQSSAAGQYHLGRVRQALGQESLAATAYKNALMAAVPAAAQFITGAGSPTGANIEHLESLAQEPGPDGFRASVQLGYLLELKGSVAEARDQYRKVFETLMAFKHVDLDSPTPSEPPTTEPPTTAPPQAPTDFVPPAQPANTLYLTGDQVDVVRHAWHAAVGTLKALNGKALVSAPANHWITLQASAFDDFAQEDLMTVGQLLSRSLHTDALFLQITRDGRAWYFYWNNGHLLDRYCSNPGRASEVDYTTLRAWGGRPDVLVRLCRGKPLSSKSVAPSITDLNAILYFYYPELRETHPQAYRTPETFMKMLARILGLPHLPSRFRDRTADGGTFHAL